MLTCVRPNFLVVGLKGLRGVLGESESKHFLMHAST